MDLAEAQSTNHIDPKAGTGGRLRVLLPTLSSHFREHAKSQAPAYSVSDKGPHARLKPLRVSQSKPLIFNSWHNPSQAFTENMRHSRP